MIPFLENDDANRALMGSNMQRQAVPLLKPEAPVVGTGIEYKAACDSGVVLLSRENGVVTRVTADEIVIRGESGEEMNYHLTKFARSNQGTCINQHPIVKEGEMVKKGQVIADGPSTDEGEISLGRNVLIGFMTWEGYNYEDAVLISERLVKDETCTPPSTSRNTSPRPATPSSARRRSPATSPAWARTRCATSTSAASSASARKCAPTTSSWARSRPRARPS